MLDWVMSSKTPSPQPSPSKLALASLQREGQDEGVLELQNVSSLGRSMRKIRLAFLPLVILAPGLMLCIPAGPALIGTAHAASKAPKAPPNSSVVEGEDIPIEGEGPKAPMAGGDDAGDAEPQSRPVPPTSGPPAPVTLTAYLSEGSAPMTADITWRIFEGHPGSDGNYRLLQTIREPQPTLELNPGEYLINIAYGRAYLTK